MTIWDEEDVVVWEDDDGDVRIDDEQIVIDYQDDQGPVVLAGTRAGGRRFELRARSRVRSAVLEHSKDETLLEGVWREAEAEGTWRVELDPERRSEDG